MIWLTWRQHRAMLAAFLLLSTALAVFYLINGISMHHHFDTSGLRACVGVTNDAGCDGRRQQFLSYHVGLTQYVGMLLTLASAGLGAFVAAPMVASEFERGTHQWVWTQRISRARWLTTKCLLLAAACVAISLGLATVYTWWNQPITALAGPFTRFGSFDNTPLMLAVYTLFAFALGVAASTMIRRTVAAIGVTLAVFLTVRLGIMFGARPHYMTPVTVSSAPSEAGRPLGFDPRDWDWRSSWVDTHGHTVPEETVSRLTNPALNPTASGSSFTAVLRQHGIHYLDAIQPHQRATTFQLIEAAIYLALTGICAALAFRRIRHRAI